MYVRPRRAAAAPPPAAPPAAARGRSRRCRPPTPLAPFPPAAAPTSQKGGVVSVEYGGSATFKSTLPANTFSNNTAGQRGSNCYNDGGTIVGTCD